MKFAIWLLLLILHPASSMSLKRILVTGGNKGIGLAICSRLLSEWKDTYVLLGSRSTERGQQAIRDLTKELGDEVCQNRLGLVQIDTSSDESVQAAAAKVAESGNGLDGIINNAGVMGRNGAMTMEEVVNTNYFGPRRVNDAFGKLLRRPGGRIVNIGSAGGPNYVASLDDSDPIKEKLAKPWLIGSVANLDKLAQSMKGDVYGASKALVAAYTCLDAKENKDLIINAVTPGWIKTDMTKGSTASNPPSKGAVPPCWLMMDEDVAKQPTGRYYGSDCVRSPLDVYRGPGDAPYVSDEDLVDLPASLS